MGAASYSVCRVQGQDGVWVPREVRGSITRSGRAQCEGVKEKSAASRGAEGVRRVIDQERCGTGRRRRGERQTLNQRSGQAEPKGAQLKGTWAKAERSGSSSQKVEEMEREQRSHPVMTMRNPDREWLVKGRRW